MYVVTNRIRTKKGFAEKMAPRFAKPGPLQEMDGFVKVEVTVRDNVEEHDELNVNMYWETLENFEAWKNSDTFREAHKGGRPSGEGGGESPMLGSELVIAKVAAVLEAK
ncbi:heme oxygenase [Planococcus lenghuensis]|uniref:Heme-degrading monooxygenase IsdG n=1 Tax=Planococcus lenghuensis TaxID=2213202 RepID=A0A1Q2L343_9BACL|nr:heme oxygenase [Planococcus lenghuensis]AQQ54833.1 heme-degrading monooxygenase IsdG [Planococcus lenghuensis]